MVKVFLNEDVFEGLMLIVDWVMNQVWNRPVPWGMFDVNFLAVMEVLSFQVSVC